MAAAKIQSKKDPIQNFQKKNQSKIVALKAWNWPRR